MSPTADRPAFRILQVTDCHLPASPGERVQGLDTAGSLRAVLDRALAETPPYDLMLVTGDLVEQPTPSAYAVLGEQLHRLPWPYRCLPGNHDDPELMRRCVPDPAASRHPPRWPVSWRILCLDSTVPGRSEGLLDDAELDRVTATIADAPAAHLLIAVHHHPVPCGSPWMDAMRLDNGDALLRLLQAPGGTRTVVFGHIHQAFEARIGRVRLLGSPATSCQFAPRTPRFQRAALPPGYRWLELDADGGLRTGLAYVDHPDFRYAALRQH